MAGITDSITDDLCDALRDTIKTNLPAKLVSLQAPTPQEVYRFKNVIRGAEFLPCVMVEAVSFAQNVGSFSAGATSLGERTYSFYVWAVVTGSDEEQAEERIAAYVDALDSVISGSVLGKTNVMDTWVASAEISAATPIASDQLKAARLSVNVKYYHQIGDVTM